MSGDDLPQLDTQHAHPARVYNYWLGGKDNFAADREAAEQAIAANPGIKTDVRANRAFLTRAVRYLAGECGVRQFLDIGTGLPVAGNTHQVAQEVAPNARIVYADNDPIVLLHARALLSSTPQGTCDLRGGGPAGYRGHRASRGADPGPPRAGGADAADHPPPDPRRLGLEQYRDHARPGRDHALLRRARPGSSRAWCSPSSGGPSRER